MDSEEDDVSSSKQWVSDRLSDKTQLPAVNFDELAKGDNEVLIEFQDQLYRLRVTKNGKLILNK